MNNIRETEEGLEFAMVHYQRGSTVVSILNSAHIAVPTFHSRVCDIAFSHEALLAEGLIYSDEKSSESEIESLLKPYTLSLRIAQKLASSCYGLEWANDTYIKMMQHPNFIAADLNLDTLSKDHKSPNTGEELFQQLTYIDTLVDCILTKDAEGLRAIYEGVYEAIKTGHMKSLSTNNVREEQVKILLQKRLKADQSIAIYYGLAHFTAFDNYLRNSGFVVENQEFVLCIPRNPEIKFP